jgi:hypothetical protein
MINTATLSQFTHKWLGKIALFAVLAASAGVLLALVLVDPSSDTAAGTASGPKPAVAEKIEGSDLKKITFTEKAVERLGIEVAAAGDNSVPYAAVLYGLDGSTFVYTNPEPLVYIRAPIVVDHYDGDRAVLSSGPPAGTSVVIVGGSELIGLEFGLGK